MRKGFSPDPGTPNDGGNMKAAKPTLYAYGTVTERDESGHLARIEIRSNREDVSLSVSAGKESSDWLEVGTVVSIRLRTKKPAVSSE
jgi:hypothetical protein